MSQINFTVKNPAQAQIPELYADATRAAYDSLDQFPVPGA